MYLDLAGSLFNWPTVSGSVIQNHGSAGPDPKEIVTDQQYGLKHLFMMFKKWKQDSYLWLLGSPAHDHESVKLNATV